MSRKCRHKECRKPLPKQKDSTTSHHRAGYCNHECAMAYLRANAERLRSRAEQKRKTDNRKAKRELYENDYSHQFQLTKKAAQRLANRLDSAHGCISCDRDRAVQFCGGHFRTAGAHPELALDIRNIMGQCNKRCNLELSGNIGGTADTRGYRRGVVARFGRAYLEWLEGPHEAKHYTCDDLRAMRKEFNAEIRRLERGEPPSKNWRQLPESVRKAA